MCIHFWDTLYMCGCVLELYIQMYDINKIRHELRFSKNTPCHQQRQKVDNTVLITTKERKKERKKESKKLMLSIMHVSMSASIEVERKEGRKDKKRIERKKRIDR